ncbi:MAG: class II aldolase/adducin family protein [Candidatus Zixiibacteriota bacterium]|nr:MAG: class II aldolase/adducin family protein [candidate division Zixibacteria bacterium]
MKKDIVRFGSMMADRGWVAGSDGNISARLGRDRILITPGGAAKGRLLPDEVMTVDSNGRKIQGPGEASTEILMHLFVYQNRPDIGACIHSHAPYATAFAVSRFRIPDDVLPELVVSVGKIPLTAYAPPGTDAVPKSLEPYIEGHNAFLLRNHGLLTIGRSLEEAYNRHETVEHCARIIHLARQLGDMSKLPKDDYRRLESLRKQMDEAPGDER